MMHTENFQINFHNYSELFGSYAALTGNVVEDLELEQRIHSCCLRVLHRINVCIKYDSDMSNIHL